MKHVRALSAVALVCPVTVPLAEYQSEVRKTRPGARRSGPGLSIRRGFALCVLVPCVLALGPGAASAATVVKNGENITYTAASGEVNQVLAYLEGSDTLVIEEQNPAVDAAVGAPNSFPGCQETQANRIECPASYESLTINAGDGNDTITNQAAGSSINGGPGDDTLTGGGGVDYLYGEDGNDTLNGGDSSLGSGSFVADQLFGGAGNDQLNGQGGTDALRGGTGADAVSGGDGSDITFYDEGPDVSVTLDGAANDGAAGEGDNVAGDVELVSTGAGNDVVVGSAAANDLNGGAGNDQITGGAGSDQLRGGAGDDLIDARDGEQDTVFCGEGADRALLDSVDSPAECEQVEYASSPPGNPDPNNPDLGGGTGGGGAKRLAPVRLVGGRSLLVRRGRVTLGLSCPRNVAGGCRGTATILPRTRGSAGRERRLGRARYTIPAGAKREITIRLTAAGRRSLRSRRRTVQLRLEMTGPYTPRLERLTLRGGRR